MLTRIAFAALLLLQTGKAFSQTYSKTPLIQNLPYAVAFEFAPDGRIFTTQKGGATAPTADAQINVYDAAGNFLSEFYDLSDSVDCEFERGLLGITIDPDFTSNHFVYVFYTFDTDPNLGGDAHLRVQRFTDSGNVGIQPTIILDIDVPDNENGAHQGGNLHFRPSDSTYIYLSLGDQGNQLGWAKQLNNPYGKILRFSKYPGSPPPADNPFYDDGDPVTGNCDWIWAYGLRNSFDFCFGPNDSLYATENGTSYYDEVNLITRGGFYGWNDCEGFADADTTTIPCHAANAIDPMAVFTFPLPSLTGIIFYTDTIFPARQNQLIVGDYMHADLSFLTLYNPPQYDSTDVGIFWIDESQQYGITCLRQGPQGCIYVMEGGYTLYGGIYMICPDAVGVTESRDVISDASITPNPAADETMMQYDLNHSTVVTIEIVDVLGRTIATPLSEEQSPGHHSLQLFPSEYGLNAGTYFVRIYADSLVLVLSLMITENY